MRLVLLAFVAVFIGALTAHFFLQDKGYVLINFMGYVAEMSVPAFALVLGVAYLGLRALIALWHAPRRLSQSVADHRLRQAGKNCENDLKFEQRH